MNADKYNNSRYGHIIEKMKIAYLAGKRIIFLVTSEPSLVSHVIRSGAILPYREESKKDRLGFIHKPNVVIPTKDNFITSDRNTLPETPTIYVYRSFEHKMPLCSLYFYTEHISGFSQLGGIQNITYRERMEALRKSIIIVVTENIEDIPAQIEPYSDIVVVPPMLEYEFKEFVSKIVNELDGRELEEKGAYKLINDDEYLNRLYKEMQGINATQIDHLLRKNKYGLGRLYFTEEKGMNLLIKSIRKEIQRIVFSTPGLSIEEPKKTEPAGLDHLSNWLKNYSKRVSNPENYENYEMKPPKGLLVAGIPGSGKSMMAKYVAKKLNVRLIRFDFGDIMGGFVGESEKNMNRALTVIESMSPCVLWVDEMEKAFAGNSNGGGHEVTIRLFGKFLTWMQDKEDRGVSCFVFATANNISLMPPELFRSGRFDEKFFTFMPNAKECSEIFSSIIEKETKDAADKMHSNVEALALFNVKAFSKEAFFEWINSHVNMKKYFIGADIAQLIDRAKSIYLTPDLREKAGVKLPTKSKEVFNTEAFWKCLAYALNEIKTYGETNLQDIAICYTQLATNNFNGAAQRECLLPFYGYNELSLMACTSEKDRPLLYDLKDEEDEYLSSLSCDYDRQLFLVVKDTLNKLSNYILKKKQ